MILDELKLLIKDLEIILIKDSRFKKDIDFKNQVKTIYLCQDKSKPIDITGLYNLAMLNKPIVDITKKNDKTSKDLINKEINKEINQDIANLLAEVNKLKTTSSLLDLSELEKKINEIAKKTKEIEG